MVIHIMLVDDYKAWRDRVRSLLCARPEWQILCEAADGLEAVQMAGDFKPDLILLDIGLPKLNGIEAARQIRKLSPNSRIIFLSADTFLDGAEVALSTGVAGFVHKTNIQGELLLAIDAVLRGEQFLPRAVPTEVLSDENVPPTG